MEGRHVQSLPNCGGADKFAVVKVEGASQPVVAAKSKVASVCPVGWKLVPKSFNAKTQAFAYTAKPGRCSA